MEIYFYSFLNSFEFSWEEECKKWLLEVIKLEDKSIKNVIFNFVGKKKILQLNKEFLNHNYYTDIITFDSSYLDRVEGEIYICIPIVKINAIQNSKGDFNCELARVIVHGILHMIGYNDKNKEELEVMRKKENKYLSLLSVC